MAVNSTQVISFNAFSRDAPSKTLKKTKNQYNTKCLTYFFNLKIIRRGNDGRFFPVHLVTVWFVFLTRCWTFLMMNPKASIWTWKHKNKACLSWADFIIHWLLTVSYMQLIMCMSLCGFAFSCVAMASSTQCTLVQYFECVLPSSRASSHVSHCTVGLSKLLRGPKAHLTGCELCGHTKRLREDVWCCCAAKLQLQKKQHLSTSMFVSLSQNLTTSQHSVESVLCVYILGRLVLAPI